MSPNISTLRPLTAPTTDLGRATNLTATHRRTKPQIAANCRTLPRNIATSKGRPGAASVTQGTASVTAETAHMGMSISELRSAGCGVAAECGARVRQLSAVIQRHTADLCGRDALGSGKSQPQTIALRTLRCSSSWLRTAERQSAAECGKVRQIPADVTLQRATDGQRQTQHQQCQQRLISTSSSSPGRSGDSDSGLGDDGQ